jgi:hypothetical protein
MEKGIAFLYALCISENDTLYKHSRKILSLSVVRFLVMFLFYCLFVFFSLSSTLDLLIIGNRSASFCFKSI